MTKLIKQFIGSAMICVMLGALLGCASTTVSHDDRAPVTKKHNKHQGLREDQVVKFATGMGAGIPLGFLLLIGVCSL